MSQYLVENSLRGYIQHSGHRTALKCWFFDILLKDYRDLLYEIINHIKLFILKDIIH